MTWGGFDDERAEALAAESDTTFLPRQFSNPDNPLCHERTTGREILHQADGKLDAFVMGVGTGGKRTSRAERRRRQTHPVSSPR